MEDSSVGVSRVVDVCRGGTISSTIMHQFVERHLPDRPATHVKLKSTDLNPVKRVIYMIKCLSTQAVAWGCHKC